MTDSERENVVSMIATDPTIGDLIVGSGGCRKVRVAGRGKGKSGGYRVVTFFAGADVPVFLLWTLSKGSVANLSKGQVNELTKVTKMLMEGFRQPTT